jgi:hypothetical protein
VSEEPVTAVDLPGRSSTEEDAYVASFTHIDEPALLIAAVSAAMDHRRPRLAARLVSLLDAHVEIEPGSPLDRARSAARLFLLTKPTAEDNSWSELDDAWKAVRKARFRRIGMRQRDRMTGRTRRIGRLSRRKR